MTAIKICGIRTPETAKLCGDLGAYAIGCVFFPKSPRHVSEKEAIAITTAVPEEVKRFAVMVNPDPKEAIRIAKNCGFTTIQLHGKEPKDVAAAIRDAGILVVKALYIEGDPGTTIAPDYPADRFLVEASQGVLPGGNARSWDWSAAADFCRHHSAFLAGGLTPENVGQAIQEARPFGVDVSSGVESRPGEKDFSKIQAFFSAVSSDHERA